MYGKADGIVARKHRDMKIVIVGAGEVGSHLAKMLRAAAGSVTVVDSDQPRLDKLGGAADVSTVHGNPTSIGVLREAGVGDADLFIAVYPRIIQEINIISALIAKQLGAAKVIARISDEDYLKSENKLLFKALGIELMFYPERMAADEIVEALHHTSSSETMDFAHGRLQINVFRIQEESPVLDMKISEMSAFVHGGDANFRVIAINHDGRTSIPKADYRFRYQDSIYVISTREGLPTLIRLFGQDSAEIKKVMIYGGTPIGEMVARSLGGMIAETKIIEPERERCMELSERLDRSVLISNGEGRNSDFLIEEGIRDYDAFVAVTDSDEANILACVAAKRFGVNRTVAEVENIEYVRLADDMGIDHVINKKLITAGRIFKFTLSGKARFVRYMGGTSAEVLEYTVSPGSRITTASLRELPFPAGAVIGGGIRGSDAFIATGDTRFEAYDRVVVFADASAVRELDSLFR